MVVIRFIEVHPRHVSAPALSELILGPMKQHAQIAGLDVQLTAEVVGAALLEEMSAENQRVAFRQTGHHDTDLLGLLGAEQHLDDIIQRDDVEMLVGQRLSAILFSIPLVKDVRADGVDVGAEPAAVANPAVRRA